MVITQARAEELLKQDVASAEAEVKRLVTVPLTQHQFDALVDFVFNCGAGNLQHSTLLRLLNAGDYASTAAHFGDWVKSGGHVLPGLVRRRYAEAQLFKS
jgi:lysozyme